MFTPKWKKEAKLLAKGGLKFLNYKSDLLKPERVDEIQSRRLDLLAAIKADDRAQADEAAKQLRATCENALPHDSPLNWLEENIEVMFVAIVIALGLRAYYLQPFRIPTGSMMPTLNGIIGKKTPEASWPGLLTRLQEKVLRGRSYVKIVNDRDRKVRFNKGSVPALDDYYWAHFFSRSQLQFLDSALLDLPAPVAVMTQIGLDDAIQSARDNDGMLKKGTVICEGTIDSGDLVLVNKFSYHFRRPERGEVFVFDTIDIRGIHQAAGEQAAGSHYIKRLCGLPGDELSIVSPNLLNHGKIVQAPGILRVSEAKGPYAMNPSGYGLADSRHPSARIVQLGQTLKLEDHARPGMREYAALGDNTRNSLDSRYWGPVKEFNLVGPALIALWPITTGHWGLID
ncbi:MAG: signal peptidase I [Verrucomicrobia bacterium]|nr:signal peptidase I [Verrucomicrobiota bacterium]